MNNLFKIRRKSDGWFLGAASWNQPKFVPKGGRVFKRTSDLSLHLANNIEFYKKNFADLEILELETTIVGIRNPLEIVEEKEERKRIKDEAYRKQLEEYKREQRRLEYERLQKEFG